MNIFLFLIKEEGEFKHSLKRTCNFAGIIHSDGTLALNTSIHQLLNPLTLRNLGLFFALLQPCTPIFLKYNIFPFFYREAEAVMVENLELHDGQEGIKAFLEKRKPTWTNTTDCH